MQLAVDGIQAHFESSGAVQASLVGFLAAPLYQSISLDKDRTGYLRSDRRGIGRGQKSGNEKLDLKHSDCFQS